MKIRDEFLPYSKPCHGPEETAAVAAVAESDWWSRGPRVSEFESAFAEYVGVGHALAENSCTAGLHLGLLALGIQPGDEVITTPMTFCATANTIVHCGATPVFADVYADGSGLIDPDEIERKITPKTKAIVPVHYAGRACDMDRINAIAAAHGLKVMEDSAHAVATRYANGKLVGDCNNICSFSFYATKNMSTGEGGMLTTNDDALYEKALVLSLHGMSRNAWNRFAKGGSWRYDVVEAGYKYNMTDFAASLGLCQLKKLEGMQRIRKQLADFYNAAFAEIPGIGVLPDSRFGQNAWHLYEIMVDPDAFSIDRDTFAAELTETYKIGISVHYIPVPLHPFYREHFGTRPGQYPHAEAMFERMISIPLYPSMTQEDAAYVAEAVREIARKYAK